VSEALTAIPTGNPSSPHGEGRAALAALDRARDDAARALGVEAAEVVFTSSGTEAVNLALLGAGRRLPPDAPVVTWAAEHQAVLGAVRRLQLEGRRSAAVVPTAKLTGTKAAAALDLSGVVVAARAASNKPPAAAAEAVPSPGVGTSAVNVPVVTAPTAAAVARTVVRRTGPVGGGAVWCRPVTGSTVLRARRPRGERCPANDCPFSAGERSAHAAGGEAG